MKTFNINVTAVFIVIVIIVISISGCSDSGIEKIYRSKHFEYSFDYPDYLQVSNTRSGMSDKIATETTYLVESMPFEIIVNVTDISKIEHIFSDSFRTKLNDFLKDDSQYIIIIPSKGYSVFAFFKPYFIKIDYNKTIGFLPKIKESSVKTRINKTVALNIIKSFNFNKHNITKLVTLDSTEETTYYTNTLTQILTLYYNNVPVTKLKERFK